MRSRLLPLVLLVAVVAGCSPAADQPIGETTTTTESASDPAELIVRFTDALAAGEYLEAQALAGDEQLALLVALEGGGAAEAEAMLSEGVPAQVVENFWAAFVAGIPDLLGGPLHELELGPLEHFSIDDDQFATVAIQVDGDLAGPAWIVRRTEEGWTVDLLATFGGAFARSIQTMASEPNADAVLLVLRDDLTSLMAARKLQQAAGANPRVINDLDRLITLFEG